MLDLQAILFWRPLSAVSVQAVSDMRGQSGEDGLAEHAANLSSGSMCREHTASDVVIPLSGE